MAARKGNTGGQGERDVFDPFGFLNDFIDQLSGCCQPNASAPGLGRQGETRQAYGDMDTPAVPLPLQSRGKPYNTDRGRGGSFTAVPAEGKVGQRTLGEVPNPNEEIAPLVKPGVHIVMPSEAVRLPIMPPTPDASASPSPPASIPHLLTMKKIDESRYNGRKSLPNRNASWGMSAHPWGRLV